MLSGLLLFSNLCSSAIASLAYVPVFTLFKAVVVFSVLCTAGSDGKSFTIFIFFLYYKISGLVFILQFEIIVSGPREAVQQSRRALATLGVLSTIPTLVDAQPTYITPAPYTPPTHTHK